jgi:hypothetical protein
MAAKTLTNFGLSLGNQIAYVMLMPDGEAKDWRELAAMASVETDRQKLIEVIAQLAQAIQRENQARALATLPKHEGQL